VLIEEVYAIHELALTNHRGEAPGMRNEILPSLTFKCIAAKRMEYLEIMNLGLQWIKYNPSIVKRTEELPQTAKQTKKAAFELSDDKKSAQKLGSQHTMSSMLTTASSLG
jgi:hypothetical protein